MGVGTNAAAGYGPRQVEILFLEAKAWTAQADQRNEEALAWMIQAADQEDALEKRPVTPGPMVPARELLGEMLLAAGQPQRALAAFEQCLAESPKRFNGLYGAGCAAAAVGERARARDFFRQLVETCHRADSPRPELLAARHALEQ